MCRNLSKSPLDMNVTIPTLDRFECQDGYLSSRAQVALLSNLQTVIYIQPLAHPTQVGVTILIRRAVFGDL
jgi:hypothetical protein